ncbi:MAG: NHL repeat-containing protein [Candidatus Binatus sp.]|uniref:NHL repeat-containing protein n=1 Tax=Candidatus Binatus sp. TaxID=2811406 RepID=UPI002716E6C4|nr:NHL repeat-containing protein [Candidatus Binatus sp.]MDO8430804.1 NHL repeat-containing protein [Candidatus Binatus sp.]
MKPQRKFNWWKLTVLSAAILVCATAMSVSSASAGSGTRPYLPPGSAGDNTADGVLGQVNFVENQQNFRDERGVNTTGLLLGDVAIDRSISPNRVFAVDSGNHRVLGWTNISAFASHAAANIVIGQPTRFTGGCNLNTNLPSASSLCTPTSVAVDSAGRLYVADSGNNRVLEYNAPFTTDRIADDIFGQFGTFATKDCNAGSAAPSSDSLCNPTGVGVDKSDNLYIADRDNNRVLEFNTPETITGVTGSGDTSGDRVFGQLNNLSSATCNISGVNNVGLCHPRSVASDASSNIYVADTDNDRVLEYNTPIGSGTGADRVFGQHNSFTSSICNDDGVIVTAATLCKPNDVAVDGLGNVYIADTGNTRVLEINTPFVSGTTADKVFGQGGSFSSAICNLGGVSASSICTPMGVSVDTGNNLYVADCGNNRELSFTTPVTTDTIADGVVSQVLFTTNAQNLVDALGLDTAFNNGGIAIDKTVVPNRVYVADYGNNRVLAWNNISAFTTHAAANLVFGQPNGLVRTPNNGGIKPTTLNLPIAVAVDSAGNLYVVDSSNNRVLEFNTPFVSGVSADKVFGQLGSFTTGTCNNGGVTANSLCIPLGVAVDSGGNVYISDSANDRMLEYNTPLTTNTTADRVFGQANFVSTLCNRGAGPSSITLCNPWGVAVDGSNNLYVADNGNNRALEYFTPIVSGVSADRVFGQLNVFTTNTGNNGGISAKSLKEPQNVAVDSSGNVYIVDKSNNRGLKYNTPGDTIADKSFGQGGLFNQGFCIFTPSPNTMCVPDGVATDASKNLYIVDGENHRILQYLTP